MEGKVNKTKVCITENDISEYLSGKISKDRRNEIENHLNECGSCLDSLVFAYKTVEEFNKKGEKSMRSSKINIWLVGTIIAFIISFVFPRYFVQALVAAILLGAKWIFESVNARILIMIYDAWKKGGEEEATKILKNFNKRF